MPIKKEKKRESAEKPVSLKPLKVEEALEGLLRSMPDKAAISEKKRPSDA